MSSTGLVLEIQRMSTEDGPGLRTSVFLKGCSLNCKWCHNPESISTKQDIQWRFNLCIHCEICVNTFGKDLFYFKNGKLHINRNLDKNHAEDYDKAVKECPTNALEKIGQQWEANKLIQELLKDKAYFTNSSEGGVTISGGEPVLQTEFVLEVFQQLKTAGVHVALDTCGMYTQQKIEKLLPFVDLVLFDIKEIDVTKHKEFTGSPNTTILDNLKFINDYLQQFPEKKLWIRTPIIPHTTDTEENISGIAHFLNKNKINFERWEICAFNNLCRDKYERLGLDWEYVADDLLTESFMNRLLITAKAVSYQPEKILWTGSVKSRRINLNEIENPIKAVNYCKITAVRT